MQARYYDPVIGRFYSNDPIGFRDVHSFNRYAYANNNPYKYTDPTGMDAEKTKDENGVIEIKIHIKFTGEASTQENRDDIASAIEDAWSTTTEHHTVTVTVEQVNSGTNNVIELKNGEGRSNAETIYVDGKGALTAAGHEGGHLMGHGDEYNTTTHVPNAGREGNIMASFLGVKVDSKNITTILSAFGSKSTVKTYKHK